MTRQKPSALKGTSYLGIFKGKMAPPVEGRVPDPYDYELELQDGSTIPFPARGTQYLELSITGPDGTMLQRVLPSLLPQPPQSAPILPRCWLTQKRSGSTS